MHHVTDALDTAAGRTQELVGDAKSRAKGLRRDPQARAKGLRTDAKEISRETRRRTSAARDALAGKRTHRWRWVAAAAAAGVGAGAAAAGFLRRLFAAREQAQLADVEATVAEHAAAAERVGNRTNGYPASGASTPPTTATVVTPARPGDPGPLA
jgi:hypothetical protein